ncbi:MAG: response regulator transcription factor [Pseudonocardia sp.]|nr:response regulator transcription factor [Pseudonocardia sp.]
MRALVVEDEARIAAFLEYGLTAEGFVVEIATNGRDGLELARSGGFDVVILDLMLPLMTGEEVLRRLRGQGFSVPVIVLTAKDAVLDRVDNLNAGADDYLVKPFSFAELLARIRARMRAGADAATSGSVITHGPLRLDLPRRRVWRDDVEVTLTNREFGLLEVFLRHPGQVLSQPQLLDLVWGYGHDPGSNVVEVYVSYLRRKVGADVIETVRGGGYRSAEFSGPGFR